MAEVLERWQVLEMEHGNLNVICRIAKMVINDNSFFELLRKAVRKKEEWLRDMAGVLFRFCGLLGDGCLELDELHRSVVMSAVECALEPLERKHPVQLCGHYYGALYMQVLVPWLCAWNGGQPTTHLGLLVQRVGRAIVHCYKAHKSPALKREVTERMHLQYLQISQEHVWGKKEDDIMHRTFYK